MLNKVQMAAFELIQSDARFLYTLTNIQQNAKKIRSNYMMMCQPYIGIFADGAEQWCKKIGFDAPTFNEKEKVYYASLRQGHKLFEKTYSEYSKLLLEKFVESDNYFYSIRRVRERVLGYYNVGTDLCNEVFCGNTIICALHTPVATLGNKNVGITIKDISVIAGKLATFFECKNFPPYQYDDKNNTVKYKDYHFYKDCPLALKNSLGFILFSILCNINYTTEFVEKYFVEEIPQKFKFAYLQYYYLCDFIKDLNLHNDTQFHLNNSLQNREFRNCLAHYGLGQFLTEGDVVFNDKLKGLTEKAFNMDYSTAKECLYSYLNDLTAQITEFIF
jgi:hypothetical protein